MPSADYFRENSRVVERLISDLGTFTYDEIVRRFKEELGEDRMPILVGGRYLQDYLDGRVAVDILDEEDDVYTYKDDNREEVRKKIKKLCDQGILRRTDDGYYAWGKR